MQVYTNSYRVSLKTVLFFAAILFVAFLPISSFLFFLKNDAFNGYFPPKFFMSESIHSGYLPLWNPYINYGIPQYGDMSSGYWSPVTWLIASTVGYNAYSFTIETLFYILTAGIGVYQLLSFWKLSDTVRFIAGVSFMCCGYHIGHLQHFNWLSGAAFLPWCLWSYLLLLHHFSYKNIAATALLLYMLVASAHPGITIAATYFFIATMLFVFFKNENAQPLLRRIASWGKTHTLLLLLTLLISCGMIAGYLDILPHFGRGEKVSLQESLENPTSLQCWLSCLLPFATVKNQAFFQTDLSMRNCYFSLTLLFFLITAIFQKKSGWQKFFLISGLIFLLLSSGGIFKTFAYKFIPLIGFVRLNGEFSIFAILCFILAAAIQLNHFFKEPAGHQKNGKLIFSLLALLLIGCVTTGVYKAASGKDSFLFTLHHTFAQPGIAMKLKSLIDAISFYDTLWIQGILQLLLLWFIRYALTHNRPGLLKTIVIADLLLASLLNIPFTGAGKAAVADVQQVLNQSPKGIPVPELKKIVALDTLSSEKKGLVGNWSMYSKNIGTVSKVPYPVSLKNTDAYFDSKITDSTLSVDNNTYVFISPVQAGHSNAISIASFAPGKISLQIQADHDGSNIVYLQNYYPHWYYNNGNEKRMVYKSGINFMMAPIAAGKNKLSFSFEPTLVKWAMLVSALCFLFSCVIYFVLDRPAFHRS